MSEAVWQVQVVELARILGWNFLHVRRSIGKGKRWTTATNLVGWPDLLLWAPDAGFVAIELKVRPNKATVEQVAVLDELRAAGARTLVAYPEDLDRLVNLLDRRKVA